MDIQQLRYVVQTAQMGSFQKAADALFITRAALSKSISQLEGEIGYPLFERLRTGVRLTEQGRALCGRMERLVDDFDQLNADMHQEHRMCEISICIPNSWLEHFSASINRYCAEHAHEVRTEVESYSDAECIRRIRSGETDMVITHLRVPGMLDAGVTLLRSPLYFAMSAENPLAAKDTLSREDLDDQNIIYYSCGFDRVFWVPLVDNHRERFDNDLMHIYAQVFRNEGILPTPLYTIPFFGQGIVCRKFVGEHDTIETYCFISPRVQADSARKEACQKLREALQA